MIKTMNQCVSDMYVPNICVSDDEDIEVIVLPVEPENIIKQTKRELKVIIKSLYFRMNKLSKYGKIVDEHFINIKYNNLISIMTDHNFHNLDNNLLNIIIKNRLRPNIISELTLEKILSLLRIIKLNEEQKFKFCKEAWKN